MRSPGEAGDKATQACPQPHQWRPVLLCATAEHVTLDSQRDTGGSAGIGPFPPVWVAGGLPSSSSALNPNVSRLWQEDELSCNYS
jgi:hypothetical protein